MKKLIFVAVFALGSLTAFAQDTEEVVTDATEAVTAQDDFAEIDASELPEAVEPCMRTKKEIGLSSKCSKI